MADVTERPQPAPMSIWPWLIAPALMLLLIVGFSVLLVFMPRGSGKTSTEPEAPAVAANPSPPSQPADDPPKSSPPPDRPNAPDADPPEKPPAKPPAATVAPLFPTRQPQPAPDLESAANAPARLTIGAGPKPLPQLSEALLLTSAKEGTPKEVPKATPQREAVYDDVVQRYILYDIGRLRGLAGRKAALDFEALDLDAIPALVRGLNRSATLDASCPVMAISQKLTTLLSKCDDLEMIAQMRDTIGKDVGTTPYYDYLNSLKKACVQRLKHAQEQSKPSVPHLVAVLKSGNASTRRKAANMLGLAGADAKAAIPALIEALKDSDSQVRGTAARALAVIGPAAVPSLLKAAQSSSDRQVRILAYLCSERFVPPITRR